MLTLKLIWWISAFVIFEAMIGYPLSLWLLNKILHIKENKKDLSYEPTVAVMVVAHNEEKVIEAKLNNLLEIDYPQEKLEFLIASDFCTDNTDKIVENFIASHPGVKIRLHKSEKHLGKTNAQNETQTFCASEILVMTDANAMFDKHAVRELVSFFATPDVAYVCGQLKYVNAGENATAASEGLYWKLDLMCRHIESKLQTITAGNGSIYAVRNKEYVKISPIEGHDSKLPRTYALQQKRALYNPQAISYEKAGENNADELKRKIRMNQRLWVGIFPDIRILNIFKYRWFSYFYFGHRTCRYLLWITHLIVLLVNIPLFSQAWWWRFTLFAQVLFYIIALWGWFTKSRNRLVRITTYYSMTILSQWLGTVRGLTGQAKSTWEKAESTR